MVPKRRLGGGSGIDVSAIGLGCMGFSGVYGPGDDGASIGVIHAALDQGVNFLDSSDMYGFGHNEELIGRAIAGRRAEAVIATKFGNMGGRGEGGRAVDGRPEHVMRACEASLKRLGVEQIDLYYQHRVDPAVPIEDTVGAMKRLVEQGKVRALGLSEARPETIRRAHQVHPIAAVQNEYSLLYRVEAEETRQTTRELGISLVAYAPLGRSLLAQHRADAALPNDSPFLRHPRFEGGNLAKNLDLVRRIEAIAREKGCTPGQLVLAWLLAQGPDVIPIPGTKRVDRLMENAGAANIALPPAEITRIGVAIPAGAAAGERYPAGAMRHVYQ